MTPFTLPIVGTIAVLVLVAFSAFFSSSETAIFTSSAEGIERRAAEGDRRASRLAELRSDPHRLLVTILVGNNVVNVAISSITTVVLVSYLPPERPPRWPPCSRVRSCSCSARSSPSPTAWATPTGGR